MPKRARERKIHYLEGARSFPKTVVVLVDTRWTGPVLKSDGSNTGGLPVLAEQQ